jgi:predicted RecB family endonuclease
MRHLVILTKSLLSASADIYAALTQSIIREGPAVVKATTELTKEFMAAVEQEGLAETVMSTTATVQRCNNALEELGGKLKNAIKGTVGAARLHAVNEK